MTLIEAQFIRELNAPEELVRQNVAQNLARHLPRLKAKRAVFVGGAPSVADHLDEIKAKRADGFDIFSMNGSANFLRNRGIVPDYHVVMDARDGNADFVKDPSASIKYLISSQCHPSVFDTLTGFDVTMWHAAGPDGVAELIHDHDGISSLVCGGGTVGLRSMYIAYLMGYVEMWLYGYDSSNRGGEKHAYTQPLNEGQPAYMFSLDGMEFEASGPMAAQAEEFPSIAQRLEDLGIKIELRCEGLLPAIWGKHKQMRDASDDEREAYKYMRMWSRPEYREHNPGEHLVEKAIEVMRMESGRVVDFGCGSGRGAKLFQDKGFRVLGVDITSKGLGQDAFIPLCIAPLWALPENVTGDYGYCTDVMEHIPPEKVDTVIHNIMRATKRAFFQICHIDDRCGAMIGMPLHLSVHPHDWWMTKFKSLGFNVQWFEQGETTSLYQVDHWLVGFQQAA